MSWDVYDELRGIPMESGVACRPGVLLEPLSASDHAHVLVVILGVGYWACVDELGRLRMPGQPPP